MVGGPGPRKCQNLGPHLTRTDENQKMSPQPSESSGEWIPDLDFLCFLHYFGILGIGDKNIKNIIVNLNVILNRFIVCAKGYDKYISIARLNLGFGQTNGYCYWP